MRFKLKKPVRCYLGIHKSDRDFGIRWHDKAVISTCVLCKTSIVHRSMWSHGGGNH